MEKIRFLAEIAFKNTYSAAEIDRWLKLFIKRFFSQQFKRSCLPDGPKVGSINLSPRGDWRMPSDASPGGVGSKAFGVVIRPHAAKGGTT